MIFSETKLHGAFFINPEKYEDVRGEFFRTYCSDEFQKNGIHFSILQSSISVSRNRGTLRGMHFQRPPHEEAKLVRCIRGSVYDVIIDLRPDSTTFKKWISVELGEAIGNALYIPKGFAHGFLSLSDNAALLYQMDEYYQPLSACGVRWDDPEFGISWPITDPSMSEKDRNWNNFLEKNR